MADYDEVRQILQNGMHEDEVLTTIGEIDAERGEYDPALVVRLVVKGEAGEPVIMAGELHDKNEYFRDALVYIGGGFSEFPFACPALLLSIPSGVEAA